jgi:hypothetical protein
VADDRATDWVGQHRCGAGAGDPCDQGLHNEYPRRDRDDRAPEPVQRNREAERQGNLSFVILP